MEMGVPNGEVCIRSRRSHHLARPVCMVLWGVNHGDWAGTVGRALCGATGGATRGAIGSGGGDCGAVIGPNLTSNNFTSTGLTISVAGKGSETEAASECE